MGYYIFAFSYLAVLIVSVLYLKYRNERNDKGK